MKHASILLDKALAKKAANVTSKHFKHPTKRPVFYNLHALCLYREALARAMDSLQHEGVTVEMAQSTNHHSTDPVNLNPPFVSSYTATQLSCRADAKQGILELNTLESKLECPTFLDAPLGIKHCAAKEEVEAAKIVIQDRFDSCTK